MNFFFPRPFFSKATSCRWDGILRYSEVFRRVDVVVCYWDGKTEGGKDAKGGGRGKRGSGV